MKQTAHEALGCSHETARNIFLESVIFNDLPRQMFDWISAPPEWLMTDTGVIQGFDCKKMPSNKLVYGYKSDIESCGKHGTFVMFTRPTIPLIGKKLYINMFNGSAYVKCYAIFDY